MSDSYVILAAGIGRRTKYIGCKSLLPYRGATIIDDQISTIRSINKRADIIIVVGFESKRLTDHLLRKECRIVYNPSYSITSQVDSLKIGLNACLTGDTTVIHGDVVFNREAIKFPDKEKAYIVVDATNKMAKTAVGLVKNNDVVTNLCYGLDEKWGQIFHIPESDFWYTKYELNTIKTNLNTYEFINKLMKGIDFYQHNKKVMTEEINK